MEIFILKKEKAKGIKKARGATESTNVAEGLEA